MNQAPGFAGIRCCGWSEAAFAVRREHEPFMLNGEAHLSTTSEGELRIWPVLLSRTESLFRIPERMLPIIIFSQPGMWSCVANPL